MRPLDLIRPIWSATTATKEDTLLGSAELQESDQAEEGLNFALMAYTSLSLDLKIIDNYKKGVGYENYNVVLPSYTGNFMPPKPDLSFAVLVKFANKLVAENTKSSEEETKAVRKNNDALINKDRCQIMSLMKKMYCLVDTDDYSRFTWVFFLSTKDKTSKSFITRIENLVDYKVKVIRCYNGTGFKNKEMNQFCEMKGIVRQYSVARTPQQNRVAERSNKTLIEATRTMLVDSMLPTTFWVEDINTTCYVQKRVLVVKPHNKTPYELFHGRTPTLSFMRPFGCLVTILNTKDHLGKFDGKADEGFFVRYSLNSKAFRVFNSRRRIVEENLHIRFSENTPNVIGSGPDRLFDIDVLTTTMNYWPIITGTQSNGFAGLEWA
nr:ribonuclease H-like domain-containing protein [Tanacetum cinerariifolium]